MIYSFSYLQQNKLMQKNDYPFTGYDGSCQYNESKGLVSIASYTELPPNNVTAMLDAVR